MTSLEAGFPSQEHLVRLDRRDGAGQRWNDAAARSSSQAEPASQRHRLVFHFALINLLAISLFAAAMVQGWIGKIVTADATRLSVVIFGVFVVGLAMSAHRTWRTNRELNEARAPRPEDSSTAGRYLSMVGGREAGSRATTAVTLRMKLLSQIAAVPFIANCLVILGLIGTVIGFIIALSGVDPQTVGETNAIAAMVSAVIAGMSVALYTTLVGAVLSIWLTVNFRVLAAGTVELITEIVERGEANADD